MTDTTVITVQWAVVVGLCLVAAGWDLARRRVPNYLVAPVFVAGLAWHAYVGGLGGLGGAFAASLILSAPYLLLFVMAGGGAGDAKLMAAVGAWLGITQGLVVLVAVSVVAIVAGAVIAVRERKMSIFMLKMVGVIWWLAGLVGLADKKSTKLDLGDKDDSIGTMPYAVVVAGGVCLAGVGFLLWQRWFATAALG